MNLLTQPDDFTSKFPLQASGRVAAEHKNWLIRGRSLGAQKVQTMKYNQPNLHYLLRCYPFTRETRLDSGQWIYAQGSHRNKT